MEFIITWQVFRMVSYILSLYLLVEAQPRNLINLQDDRCKQIGFCLPKIKNKFPATENRLF